jgi:hypothetical protein
MEKIEVRKNIFLVSFPTHNELCSTFLRFQEYYESPEFRGKIFTLDEYKDWYIKIKGSFSYFTDWSGFNISSNVFVPFREGKFNPLSEQEINLLKSFENDNGPFYLIGVSNTGTQKDPRLLKHEIAHGLFYTEPEYKRKAQEILSRYDLEDLKNWLRDQGGYHESVIEDECHAYGLTGSRKLTVEIPQELSNELNALFESYQD